MRAPLVSRKRLDAAERRIEVLQATIDIQAETIALASESFKSQGEAIAVITAKADELLARADAHAERAARILGQIAP